MEGLEGGAGAVGEEVPVEDYGAPVGGPHSSYRQGTSTRDRFSWAAFDPHSELGSVSNRPQTPSAG
ncbi:MAG: hypothetical protein DRJ64_03595 [Thermoprotei archaeon]|nr:MAG: hypothetical protein DRJ64_03595 [Thermoprotei archaeon]